MKSNPASSSAQIRARLSHPVIDSDGHTSMIMRPDFLDALREVGGPDVLRRYTGGDFGQPPALMGWYGMSPGERQRHKAPRPWWWAVPQKNTRDFATSILPALLYERLDEIGLDFSVLYDSTILVNIVDDEVRQAACYASNKFRADLLRAYADRITPAAEIPANTPREAIAELERAVKELGMKVVMFPGFIQRPIPADPDNFPKVHWLDTLGLDSEYDYDPVWAKCAELKVAPTFHQHGYGVGARTSRSNFVYNFLGHLPESLEAVCKSVFLGGVTRRFPQLKFAFHEGGVGWACLLYYGLLFCWAKRNGKAIDNYNPATVDRWLLSELMRTYGQVPEATIAALMETLQAAPEDGADDFDRCGIERGEDFIDRFVSPFFFGCEVRIRPTLGRLTPSAIPLGRSSKTCTDPILAIGTCRIRPMCCKKPGSRSKTVS
jgi:predicted TIM-barrel fold metal-dependent hydrolase